MKSLIYYWHFDPATILLVSALGVLYLILTGFKIKKGASLYFSGLLLMLLAESSPLHFLAMHYLFSAHMVVHILLLLICGPLMVLGIPAELPSSIKKNVSAFSRFLNHYPWISWSTGIGVMWFWHIPAIFNSTHSYSFLPILQTISLLSAGIIFSWPLIGPFKQYRVHPLTGIVYLFTACVGCSLLGLLITFAPPGIYTLYFKPGHSGLANLIRDNWGITAESDVQAAGLIMWVPCCFIYLSGAMYLLGKWLAEKDIQSDSKETNVILNTGK